MSEVGETIGFASQSSPIHTTKLSQALSNRASIVLSDAKLIMLVYIHFQETLPIIDFCVCTSNAKMQSVADHFV